MTVRALALLAGPCCALGAAAQEVERSFPAVLDTSIYNPNGDALSDGQGVFLWVSVIADGVRRRALLKFDLGSIPPGATVTEARLDLYQSRARAGHDVSLHRLQQAWGEGASDGGSQGTGAPAQENDATWLHRFYPHTFWSTPGGDFDTAASATVFVSASSQTYSWLSRPLSQGGPNPKMADDVQRWVNDPRQNHGWILIGDESVEQNAKRFQSAENSSLPPSLAVRYTLPAAQDSGDVPLPGWALAALAAALMAGLARSRAGRA